jgi:hypothetical protein
MLPTQTWVTKRGSVFSVMMVKASFGGLNAYADVRPSPLALAVFPKVCHPSCSFLCFHLVGIHTFLAILLNLSSILPLPTILYLNFVEAGTLEVAWVSTALAFGLLCFPSSVGERSNLPECPGVSLVRLAG